jgi:hypothetical protein
MCGYEQARMLKMVFMNETGKTLEDCAEYTLMYHTLSGSLTDGFRGRTGIPTHPQVG